MYYEGDTALKSQLITFYELLNNVQTAQEVEELFHLQQDLAEELSYSVDLSRSYGDSEEEDLSEAEREK